MTASLLMLTRYDRLGASSRLRSLQYLPALQAAGINTQVLPFFPNAYLEAQYSGQRRIGLVMAAYARRVQALLQNRRPSAIWLEYEVFPWLPFALEQALLSRAVPLVVDYDDAIFHRYGLHNRALVRQLLGTKIDRVMARADIVQAGNPYLAARAQAAGAGQIEHLPTVVDLDRYQARGDRDGPLCLGWIGTPSTWDLFMAPMLPALGPLCAAQGAEFLAVGASMNQRLPWVTFRNWSEADEVSAIQDMDIGLMPLNDDPWARGKCGYKLIQYMACGVPVVASPVGVNTDIVDHGVTGFLASTPAEWEAALTQLINDPALRARMGAAARKRIEADYSLQVHAPRMVGWLTDLMGAR